MNAPLRSLDDLFTDEERAELTADLAAIHKAVHPCWERHSDHRSRELPSDPGDSAAVSDSGRTGAAP